MEEWLRAYLRLEEFLEEHDPHRTLNLGGKLQEELEELQEHFKEAFVIETVGDEVKRAREWVSRFKDALETCAEKLSLRGIRLSKELGSFVQDTTQHLKKKLFIYVDKLCRKTIELEDFRRSASAALTTSLRTNLRTIYQDLSLIHI